MSGDYPPERIEGCRLVLAVLLAQVDRDAAAMDFLVRDVPVPVMAAAIRELAGLAAEAWIARAESRDTLRWALATQAAELATG